MEEHAWKKSTNRKTRKRTKWNCTTAKNNDILGDMPNWLIHTGSHIIYGLIGLLIIFAALFSYPDTVKTGVTIDDLSKTAWITVGQSGIIDRFFVEDRQQVKRNDTLGILRNAASMEDVKKFSRVLGDVEAYYRTNEIKVPEPFSVRPHHG